MTRTKEELELCRENVARNIVNVAIGEPLDMPLALLNQSCKFGKAWDKFAGKDKEVKAKKREYRRKYYQKSEVKAKQREYQRKYYQKPEVKAKKREYQREYYQNNADKIKKLQRLRYKEQSTGELTTK